MLLILSREEILFLCACRTNSSCHSSPMNPLRLVLAVVAVFVGLFASGMFIHGGWLQSTYKETMHLWRSESDMSAHMGWMVLGQFLFSLAFVVIWSKGFPSVATLGGSCLYGLTMGLFAQAGSLITYSVQPIPGILIAKWFVAGLAQGLLMGLIVYAVGRPKARAVAPAAD
jgi:hypothetical protein